MSPSFVETFEAPHLGMDTESAPHRLAKGFARRLVNVLTGRPGRLPVRGGINRVSPSLWAATGDSAVWMNPAAMLLGRAGDTTLVRLQNDFTRTTIPVTADQIPAGPHVDIGGHTHGITTTGKFMRWEGGSGVTGYTNAPTGGTAMIYWNSRIWYLGGTAADGTAGFGNYLYWSDLVVTSALPDTVAAWQDDVSGLINKLILSGLDGANVPVGMAALPNALVVFGQRSATLLIGSSPSNLTIRDRAVLHGCVDRRAIISHSGGVIWAAPEGIFYYDGTQEIEVSARIRSEIQTALASETGVEIVRLPNDYVLVRIKQAAATLLYMLHVPTQSWSTVSLAAVPRSLLQVDGVFTGATPFEDLTAAYFDGRFLFRLDEIARPRASQRTGSDVDTAGASQPFQASATSRLSILAAPPAASVIRRLTATSICERSAGSAGATEGWTVALRDVSDASLLASSQLTSAATGLPNMQSLKHDIFEVNDEASAMYVAATFTGSTAATFASGELQDITVEYDTAQKPASF